MIENIDRVAVNPNRKLITPESGDPFYASVEWADNPIKYGTLINKLKLDELLAASGVTAGTESALTLAQPGFSLFDGACVRFRLHVSPTPSPDVTLNVNGTGAKTVVTTKGKPLKAASVGSWITVVYSSVQGSFILQGEGGGQGRFGNDSGQISSYQFIEMGYKSILGGF